MLKEELIKRLGELLYENRKEDWDVTAGKVVSFFHPLTNEDFPKEKKFHKDDSISESAYDDGFNDCLKDCKSKLYEKWSPK
jgi:hypothetical protein